MVFSLLSYFRDRVYFFCKVCTIPGKYSIIRSGVYVFIKVFENTSCLNDLVTPKQKQCYSKDVEQIRSFCKTNSSFVKTFLVLFLLTSNKVWRPVEFLVNKSKSLVLKICMNIS